MVHMSYAVIGKEKYLLQQEHFETKTCALSSNKITQLIISKLAYKGHVSFTLFDPSLQIGATSTTGSCETHAPTFPT